MLEDGEDDDGEDGGVHRWKFDNKGQNAPVENKHDDVDDNDDDDDGA